VHDQVNDIQRYLKFYDCQEFRSQAPTKDEYLFSSGGFADRSFYSYDQRIRAVDDYLIDLDIPCNTCCKSGSVVGGLKKAGFPIIIRSLNFKSLIF